MSALQLTSAWATVITAAIAIAALLIAIAQLYTAFARERDKLVSLTIILSEKARSAVGDKPRAIADFFDAFVEWTSDARIQFVAADIISALKSRELIARRLSDRGRRTVRPLLADDWGFVDASLQEVIHVRLAHDGFAFVAWLFRCPYPWLVLSKYFARKCWEKEKKTERSENVSEDTSQDSP